MIGYSVYCMEIPSPDVDSCNLNCFCYGLLQLFSIDVIVYEFYYYYALVGYSVYCMEISSPDVGSCNLSCFYYDLLQLFFIVVIGTSLINSLQNYWLIGFFTWI